MTITADGAQQPPTTATTTKKPIMGGGTASAMNMHMNMTTAPNSHDRFAVLDALGSGNGGAGTGGTASQTLSLHSMNTPQQPNSLSDLGGWSMTPAQTTNANSATATAMPVYSLDSSWKVSASMVPPASSNTNNDDDDGGDDNGFAMGGTAGAGLEPLAAAPAAPPPPPPPAAGLWSF
jgi:hypothetical protein